jgi:hypothetical protein
MFDIIRDFHDLHAAQHMQSLSMAEPRGLGFADEPINASDYIMSGVSGEFYGRFLLWPASCSFRATARGSVEGVWSEQQQL